MIGKNVKVVLVGDETVGKTSLTRRFVDDKFIDVYKKTLGFEVCVKSIHLEDQTSVIFSIWDIGGDSFQKQQVTYFQNTRGIFLVFDHSNPESFQNIPAWAEYIRSILPDSSIPIVLIGNKTDLLPECGQIIPDEIIEETRRFVNAADYLPTSAKTGENVDTMFEVMGMALFE